MEPTSGSDALTLLREPLQALILLVIIGGLIYGARKSKIFRIVLCVVLGLLLIAALVLFLIFKDMGKGWAL